MLKVGDKVKFLNAVGGGVITGFLSPKVANVKDDDGFEVPMMVSELVKNVRYVDMPVRSAREAAKPHVQEVKKPKKETQPLFASSAGSPASAEAAWFLAFVPEVPTMPLSGEIKAWLVNDSKFTVMYHFSLLTDGSYQSEKSGRLAPYSAVPLKGFVHQDLSNLPEFGIQLLPFDKSAPSLKSALVKTLRVNPVKLYKETSYVANNYFDKRVMLVDIREKDMSKELEKLKQHDFSAPAVLKEPEDNQKAPAVKKEPADLKEVDLHIGELVESYSGLSNKEILDIQMERFTSELEAAIKKGIRRIVFIHGVGQGTLKNELRRVLSATYKKYDVQDASFREYGYGATMVILKRG